MSDERDAERGRQARDIVENEVYAESFAAVRAEIIAQWEVARSAGDREQLHMMLGLLGKTRTALESVMRSGEIAQAEIARKKTMAERIGLRRAS